MKKGKFIVFEGLDACGKSTLSQAFAKNHGFELLGAIPDELKTWLTPIADTTCPQATFSYFTLCNIMRGLDIKDRLHQGQNVVLDRFFYTSFVYHKQLLGKALPESIKELYASGSFPQPDLVIFLDVPQAIRSQRIAERGGELQWYGDQVSVGHDLTNNYFRLFQELGIEALRIDNHRNSIAEALTLIEEAYLKTSTLKNSMADSA